MPMITSFLRQSIDEPTPADAAWRQLAGITGVHLNEPVAFGASHVPALSAGVG
jgi:hypothetical protein